MTQHLRKVNMHQAINAALDSALGTHANAMVFGLDVAFGGVFRCTKNLQGKYGKDRVFNTPLTEQGIVGFAIGLASNGWLPIAEIQFADYMFPAFDQIINEAAKIRYRSAGEFDCGGLVIRAPCGTVGHGGHYHSQSPEAYLCHTAGLKVVMPCHAQEAHGLLLACVADRNPCIFLEPKALYRTSIEGLNEGDSHYELGKASIVRRGNDLTIVSYGSQILRVLKTLEILKKINPSLSVEVINLRTLLPYDSATVIESVKRTGRLLVTHEAPSTCGYGAEVMAGSLRECWLYLKAPPERVCGFDCPVPHINEHSYLPNENRLLRAIIKTCEYK
ncbi:2-oxoisovalerate dehydrogenase subunit beta mitochondrial-like protein [Perkinsela sp. CCAP 1560/4]|nr:2-oxoisovalerate dehydrogenase subunit beta mitochondrial-like protein [Perkinsela sp. CCAP 1560/4]|eukprot:KNH07641.1 2-oxoisovalerate dehydrogenase subunit beta mitochondrial-like protein [Perkinsela sp. CCAP 1560/4]